jgi:polar amino acid transport system substrate-binding protein
MASRPSPTITAMRVRSGLAVLPFVLVPLVACAPQDENKGNATDTNTSAAPATGGTASASPGDACATDQLPLRAPGQLTIATDSPAYEPWFQDNDPSNGKGFESAVAYAVADQLGFTPDQVSWVKVPFNNSYKPGPKDFDFDINQISITPERAQVVDFSDGYYAAAQSVIALKDSDIASATSLADLQKYKLGAQTGTTSLTAIRETIKPESDPAVFQSTSAAKQALLNGQVDGIVADLPTAFYITAAEIKNSTIVGQFQPVSGEQEEFGMLFEKGSPLVACVDQALATLTSNGTLDQLEQQWLSNEVDVPVLQ